MAQFRLYLGHSATGVAFACSHATGSGEGGWGGYVNIDRIVAANISKGVKGNRCRITIWIDLFDASSSIVAHIGKKSPTGDVYDFAGTPAQVKWAGSGTLSGGGGSYREYVSDWFTLPENFDPTSDYLVALGLTTAGGNISSHNAPVAGNVAYYKGGAPDPAQIDKTGYTAQADLTKFISKIEIGASASGNVAVIPSGVAVSVALSNVSVSTPAAGLNPAGWDSSIEYYGSVIFSNGDKTAIGTTGGGGGELLSVTRRNSGKYFVEEVFGGNSITVGLASLSFTGAYLQPNGDVETWRGVGTETVYPGVFPPLIAGDVVGIAADFNTGKVWFRVNGGPWNNDPLQGPV